ncbi:Tubulin/FtsZ family, GTPase domain-containing protein [Obelidium mucronatum]|nr:Tubulin/FtsZ family, GTPase domain-containing protein [Obelidium mucronatum]
MPECVIIPVGQCGNQIAARFYDLALQEMASADLSQTLATSTFFEKHGKAIRARAVLVDMEEGVLGQTLNSPLGPLFASHQVVAGNSGSGNNWAVGYNEYGNERGEELSEKIRIQAEGCNSLQSFFILNSLGGGTGSGLGSYIIDLLNDEYPQVYRFATAICPSEDDDVVTSPYNSMLSMSHLIKSADCILPVENEALIDIYNKISAGVKREVGSEGVRTRVVGQSVPIRTVVDSGQRAFGGMCSGKRTKQPFDEMNNIVANLIINITSSMRFEGTMNVDINDIVTNLVPFPRRKFLLSSMTPLYTLADVNVPTRRLDQMFTDAFSKDCQLIKADPKSSTFLACALMIRGQVEVSDIRRNVDRAKSWLKFADWNQDGWKTGLCSVPPIGQTHSLLTLSNNVCISDSLDRMRCRFVKLYKRKANLHHYLNYIDKNEFDEALESVHSLIQEYRVK